MASGGARIHIGTSGWHYPHWRGPFYPPDLPPRRFFEHYAARFDTVEINNTFYRLPDDRTFAGWRGAAPAGFLYAVKASRFITHLKKLTAPRRALTGFVRKAALLGPRLGPILFQLPPRWAARPDRLARFLRTLPRARGYAFEFRDPSWFQPAVYEALARHRVALCVYDLAGYTSPLVVTSDLVYVRLHGPGGAYQGEYGPRRLAPWAKRIAAWAGQGRRVYCYFDNDQAAYAVRDALRLKAMLAA